MVAPGSAPAAAQAPSTIETTGTKSTPILRHIVPFIALIGLTGCMSTYKAPLNRPNAEIFATAETDESVSNSRMVWLEAFKNEECADSDNGIRLGSSPPFANTRITSSPPNAIAAEEKFVFTAVYMDARFAQNRQCSLTGAFIPREARRYKVLVKVDDHVTSCGLGLYDVTTGIEQQVEFTMPKYACRGRTDNAGLNGRPLWTNWQVQVVR